VSDKKKAKFSSAALTPALRAKIDAANKPAKPAVGLKFVKEKFRGINLKTAPALLLSPKKTFYGHKRIIFAGLCAWVVNSADYRGNRDAISLATAKRIIAAENSQRLKKVPASIKYLMQSEARYQPLFKTLYYQIGGLSALTRAYSLADKHAKKRKKAIREIRYLVAVAAILDFHARNLMTEGSPYGYPNIIKAGALAGIIPAFPTDQQNATFAKKVRKKTTVSEYLKEHRKALAFLYAADRVAFDDGTTILDRLLDGRLKYADVTIATSQGTPSKLEQWFSYAKYFTDKVIALMHYGPGKFPLITATESVVPTIRDFSPEEITAIKKMLGAKAPSEKRH
jgi:hypothetical protein